MFLNLISCAVHGDRAHCWQSFLVLSCALLLSGCGSPVYQSKPVDGDKARDILKEVLEAWKGGDSIESLQKQEPPIIVQDFDWMSGAKLLDYTILPDDKEIDANLEANVKLKLKDKAGAESEKTVIYLVGTAPKMTVFRGGFQ